MLSKTIISSLSLLLSATLGISACSESGKTPVVEVAETARIEGQITYRERMMLPPGAEVEIQLQDISRADAMATVLATVTLTPESGPPYPFAIEYDPANIDSRMRYALRATITVGDKMMFATTDYIDAFSGNPVEVLVRRVAAPVNADAASLEGAPWTLLTLGGETAALGSGGKPVDLQFSAEGNRASGFSGCNRYTGGYAREGTSQHGSPLSFGNMAGTMMACADGAEIEQTYLQMLGRVDAFRVQGKTLSLLQGDQVLATFQAQ
jgi:putative lipoprotein